MPLLYALCTCARASLTLLPNLRDIIYQWSLTSISIIIKLGSSDHFSPIGHCDDSLQSDIRSQYRAWTFDDLSVHSQWFLSANQIWGALWVCPNFDRNVIISITWPGWYSNCGLLAASATLVPLDKVLPLSAQQFRLKIKEKNSLKIESFSLIFE